jgi:hypothetical protein
MSLRRRHDNFKAALIDAQRSRDYMPMTFHNNDVDPYWNTYEMLVMLSLVNKMRESLDKQFITWQDIYRCERMASGHIDYTSKFALYCAELVDK